MPIVINGSGTIAGLSNDSLSGNLVDGGTVSAFASTGIDDNADATAIVIDSAEKVTVGGSGSVSSDSQVAVKGGNLELSTAGSRYWIARASDGALTGSLYSPTGSELRLSGAGTGSGSITFEPSSTSGAAVTLNSAGNMGLGVVPESWGSSYRALQLGTSSGGTAAFYSSHDMIVMAENVYNNSGDKYINTSHATQYLQSDGWHKFNVASSGSADAAISWTTAMTITNGGDAIIGGGATTVSHVEGGSYSAAAYRNNGNISMGSSQTSTVNRIEFRNPNGLVGRVFTSGANTYYYTSSDYRLKENLVPITDSIERVKALKPYRFNFITDPDTTVDGFLAHEVAEIVPEASGDTPKDAMTTEEYEITPAVEEVRDDEGNIITEAVDAVMGEREVIDPQGIDQAKLVPLLTAALQTALSQIEDLTARIESLEAQ